MDDQKLFLDLGIIEDNNKSIVINGSGVNKDFYYYSPINFKSKDVVINFLMVSRLLKDKGVYEFIEAAKIALLRFNKINFILVGDIDDNPNSIKQDEVDLWQKKSIIKWIKYEKDIREIIKDIHVFILPSYREGTPRSVLEAMSMGRTIITTDVPGCRETVIDGLNGYLIKHKSSSDIVNAISKIIKNPNSIIEMGKESRKIIEEKYDVNYVNSKIISNMNLNIS